MPFTVDADIDFGGRNDSYLTESSADVTIREGGVPDTLGESAIRWPSYEVDKDRFILRLPNGLRFYICDGETIHYERPSNIKDKDVLLFLLGPVWGALAYQRNLLPLSASGLMHDGDIYAFTGASCTGKSTLCAALSERGHKFFSDDILIIDPSKLGIEQSCFAGQRELKLWESALDLTGSECKDLIREDESIRKFYVNPSHYSDLFAGRLNSLYFLSELKNVDQPSCMVELIKGAAAIKYFSDSIYRYKFGVEIIGQKKMFEWASKLALMTDIYVFTRPFSQSRFNEGIEFMENTLPHADKGMSLK